MSILGDLGLVGKLFGVSDGAMQTAQSASQQHIQQYYNQALNNQLANGGLQSYTAAQAMSQSRSLPQMTMNISTMKLNAQVLKLVDQLPMSIAGSIDICAYYERDPDEAARFVVQFSNGHKLTFYDVDNFPSAEQIGRIALECP